MKTVIYNRGDLQLALSCLGMLALLVILSWCQPAATSCRGGDGVPWFGCGAMMEFGCDAGCAGSGEAVWLRGMEPTVAEVSGFRIAAERAAECWGRLGKRSDACFGEHAPPLSDR